MDKKIIIAIDGFSSTGKSTIAKRLAHDLGYIYVDTGAMYRAITYFAITKGYISEHTEDMIGLLNDLPDIHLDFIYNPELKHSEIYLNGNNVEKQIRTMSVSSKVSRIAEMGSVRKKLVEIQQKIGAQRGVVMDGRDIGTVVFPDAELKFFLTASTVKRAKRRYKELVDNGQDVSFNDVLSNIKLRDEIDSTRALSPLKKAPDAVEIDNTGMGIEWQYRRIYNRALRTIERVNQDQEQ